MPAAQRLRGREAVRLHFTVITGLVLCVAAFWFELKRALGGNALSWAYVFEWPLLAVFAVYMWWQFLHPGLEKRKGKKDPQLDPFGRWLTYTSCRTSPRTGRSTPWR